MTYIFTHEGEITGFDRSEAVGRATVLLRETPTMWVASSGDRFYKATMLEVVNGYPRLQLVKRSIRMRDKPRWQPR